MTALEDRLRSELPELADVLVGDRSQADNDEVVISLGGEAEPVTLVASRQLKAESRRWPAIALAAACVIAVVALALALGSGRKDESLIDLAAATKKVPVDFGTWTTIADAPIQPRSNAVSEWTGSDVVFWAGSNLDRTFAHTDGAAYDPVNDVWNSIKVPGWGHPGLTSDFFEGEIYALAKGGGTRFDTDTGIWRDLPAVQGMFLAATVATDDAIWGLGPAGQNPSGQPDLAIARFDPADNDWVYGPSFEATDQLAGIVPGIARLESEVVWTGSDIVVWSGATGVAFNPDEQQWRFLPTLVPPSRMVQDSKAVVTDRGLTVLLDSDDGMARIATYTSGAWNRLGTELPVTDFASITAASADDWLVVFSADESPAIVHMPTGAWERFDDSPIGGVEGINVTWTGTSLVAWGGRPAADSTSAPGAIWTPPN